jgi:hypothetical protein
LVGNTFVVGVPKENSVDVLWLLCPKDKPVEPEVEPNGKNKGLDSSSLLPFPFKVDVMSLVGLESIRNSESSVLTGLAGRGTGATPNTSGLLETSLAVLVVVGAPNENAGVCADDAPNVNIDFLPPAGGGVVGVVPNVNGPPADGPFELGLSGCVNEKPVLDAGNFGCCWLVDSAAEADGSDVLTKVKTDFGVSDVAFA